MDIRVSKDRIKIDMQDFVHKGEYKINTCEFDFTEEYTSDLVKVAIFTVDEISYRVVIQNDECDIPEEALLKKGACLLGVYAYKVEGEELKLRYSPRPVLFDIQEGSYREAENGTILVPALTLEEYEQALNDLLADVETSKEEIIEEVTTAATTEAVENIDSYMDQFVKITTEMTDFIHVEDSSNLPTKSKTLGGNATQETTSISGGDEYDSPSPDHPQDIHVVTGDNVVKVVGKNLFDPALLSQVEGYNTYNSTTGLWTTSASTGYGRSILYSATGDNHNVDISKVIKVEPNTTYTLKFYDVVNSNNNTIKILYADSTGTNISTLASQPMPTITFTTPANCKYIDIARQENNTGTFSFSKIQLELGSTATSYEPYTSQSTTLPLGNLELARIPGTNYQDFIFKAITGDSIYDSLDSATKGTLTSGAWYKQAMIYKMTLSTTSLNTGYINGVLTKYGVFKNNDMPMRAVGGNKSNEFISNKNAFIANYDTTFLTYPAYRVAGSFVIVAPPDETVENFNSKIAGTTLYYVLATPTYTQITDTTLITALEQWRNTPTYKNITNSWIEPSSTNAQAEQEWIYIQDLETRLNSIEERLRALEPTTVATSSVSPNLSLNSISPTSLNSNELNVENELDVEAEGDDR